MADDISRSDVTAKDGVKLGLNLIHFLVTKEECKTMTIYGQGQGKMAMATNKCRALRSMYITIYIV